MRKGTPRFPEPYGRVEALIEEVLNSEKTVLPASLRDYDALRSEKAFPKFYTAKDARAKDDFKSLAINTLSFLAEATVRTKKTASSSAMLTIRSSPLDVYFYGSFRSSRSSPAFDGAGDAPLRERDSPVDEKAPLPHEYMNHPFADLRIRNSKDRAPCAAP